jgi:drug/metabolite transporter (DMT)-like permease
VHLLTPIFAVIIILGSYPLITKSGLNSGIHPLDVLALRCVPVGLLLFPSFIAVVRIVDRRAALLLSLAGLSQGLLAGSFAIGALRFTTASHSVLGPAMVGFFSVVIGWLVGGAARATSSQTVACILSGVGCATMVLTTSFNTQLGVAVVGDLLFLGAAVASAIYIHITAFKRLSPLQIVAIVSVPSTIIFLPIYIAIRMNFPMYHLGIADWLLQFITQAVLMGAVLNIFLAASSRRIGAHRTSLGVALVPVVTTVLAALAFGEIIPLMQWLAVGFLCAGSLLGITSRNRVLNQQGSST